MVFGVMGISWLCWTGQGKGIVQFRMVSLSIAWNGMAWDVDRAVQ